jgi:hypothetical protein
MQGSALGQTWSSMAKCIIIMNPWVVRLIGACRARQQSGRRMSPSEGEVGGERRRLKV